MRSSRARVIPIPALHLTFAALGALALLVATTSAVAADLVTVTPLADTNPVGTTHTMTATVTPAGAGHLVRFRVVAGPNEDDSGDAFTNSAGQATLSYLGDGGEGTDAVIVWVDEDLDGVLDGGEPLVIATKTWTAVAAVSLVSLEPELDTNPVGTSHQLTATVAPAQSGVIVRFEVLAGPNAGDELAAATNSSGVATASYVGDGGVGTDILNAWGDLDGDGVRDGTEPALAATKIWTSGGSVSGLTLSPVADTNPVGTSHELTATLTPAQNKVRVQFEVLSGPNAGDRPKDDTNSSGNGVVRSQAEASPLESGLCHEGEQHERRAALPDRASWSTRRPCRDRQRCSNPSAARCDSGGAPGSRVIHVHGASGADVL